MKKSIRVLTVFALTLVVLINACEKGNKWIATVDFGNGECDDIATKYWESGSKEFSLKGLSKEITEKLIGILKEKGQHPIVTYIPNGFNFFQLIIELF